MPLVKRKQVAYLPLPKGIEDGTIPADQEVWQIKQTGEIFVDYTAFEDRIKYYMQPIFTCEYTGKSGMDYFAAYKSEQDESNRTQQAFPEQLKPRVLRACHFQVEGRLERLVDLTFDRLSNRFFLEEGVIITDPTPQPVKIQYFGVIVRVTPPKHIRDLLRAENREALASVLHNGLFRPEETSSEVPDEGGNVYPPEELDDIAHIVGGRQLELDQAEVDRVDDPNAYSYTVQLLQGNMFTGSILDVTCDKLERDRTTWNKALLKKYLKESLTRDPAVGSPWMCKERLSEKYNFSLDLPEHLKIKSHELRVDLLHRRRKQPKEEDPNAPPKPKKQRSSIKLQPLDPYGTNGEGSESSPSVPTFTWPSSGPAPNERVPTPPPETEQEKKRRIWEEERLERLGPKPKYPVEDLDLDPTTIFDGRVRRAKHIQLPPLPRKPDYKKDLPVPQEHMDRTLMCWNILNIFGVPLQISPFTLDDFVNALYHDTLDPRCTLLGEIHSVLTTAIAAESPMIPGMAKAFVDSIPHLAATDANTDGMSIAKREIWVNAALDFSRGWDRKARPKASDGRRGWERHLLGILTQKGGLEAMPSLPTIFKHLFTDEDYESEPEDDTASQKAATVTLESTEGSDKPLKAEGDDVQSSQEDMAEATDSKGPDSPKPEAKSRSASEEVAPPADSKDVDRAKEVVESKNAKAPASQSNGDEVAEEDEMELDSTDEDDAVVTVKRTKKPRFAGTDHPDPEARYLTLSLEHKLDILTFLCETNLQSKVVKAYMEDCELRLTEERKEKAEINREKKELMDEKRALLKPKLAAGAGPGEPDELKPTNGDESMADESANATPLLRPDVAQENGDWSRAPSEREMSMLADEPGSREPSSSPLPELDDSSSTKSFAVRETAGTSDAEALSEADGNDEVDGAKSEADDTSQINDDEADEAERDEVDGDEEGDDSRSADAGDEAEGMDIGSDVDELQSSVDEQERVPVKPPTPVVVKAPRGGKGRKGKTPRKKKKGAKSVDRTTEIEQELEMNAKKDDLFERDWRRFREVARIRPLGKDRFHNRHWWFDGIGPQSLIAPNGAIIYGAGRLFVQGPSQADFDMMCVQCGGEQELRERMAREEGDGSLAVDEWAYLDDEETIDVLHRWLNVKGIREKDFKQQLDKWKHYIVEGAKSRQKDLLLGFEATAPPVHQRRTRGARGREEYHDNPSKHYLAYENSLAQK